MMESQLIHTIKGEKVIQYCQEYENDTFMDIYYILEFFVPALRKGSIQRRGEHADLFHGITFYDFFYFLVLDYRQMCFKLSSALRGGDQPCTDEVTRVMEAVHTHARTMAWKNTQTRTHTHAHTHTLTHTHTCT